MVGLPARGKTYISKKLTRYLNWIGVPTRGEAPRGHWGLVREGKGKRRLDGQQDLGKGPGQELVKGPGQSVKAEPLFPPRIQRWPVSPGHSQDIQIF
jgi:hypothetical protein